MPNEMPQVGSAQIHNDYGNYIPKQYNLEIKAYLYQKKKKTAIQKQISILYIQTNNISSYQINQKLAGISHMTPQINKKTTSDLQIKIIYIHEHCSKIHYIKPKKKKRKK